MRGIFTGLKRINIGYVFIAPAVLFLMLISFYPMLDAFKMSFFDEDGRFIGVYNFIRASRNPLFINALLHTLYFTAVSVIFHLGLGLLLAILLTQLKGHYRTGIRTIVMLAWAIPPAIVAVIWRILYHPNLSFVPIILKSLGLGSFKWQLLANPHTSLAAVVIANIWFALPFYMLMILAGLQAIPKELYEAATVDGAGAINCFRWITVPGVRNIMVTLAIFDTIGCFVFFDLVFLMTKGGPVDSSEVLPTYIYKIAFTRLEFNYAAAMSVMMFFLITILCGLLYLLKRR